MQVMQVRGHIRQQPKKILIGNSSDGMKEYYIMTKYIEEMKQYNKTKYIEENRSMCHTMTKASQSLHEGRQWLRR